MTPWEKLRKSTEDVDFLESRTLTPSFFAVSSKFQTDRLPAPNPNELKALQSQTHWYFTFTPRIC